MCEEVRAPAIQVPKAIVGGLILNALAGLAFLIPIAFVLPDISYLANLASGQPVPPIFKAATGNSAGAFCLLIPLLILGIICGVGCVTAASRSVWAFARDGAIPGSKWFKKVEPRLDNIPLNAMLLGMIIELLLGLIYFGSTAAYNAFSGVGVMFLTLSYACPVAVSLILRKRRDIKNCSFNLGPLGLFCNIVCLGKWARLFPPTHWSLHPQLPANISDVQSSMDLPRHPSLLHAHLHGRHAGNHELRLGRLRWFLHHFCRVVLGVGLSELRRSPDRRGYGGYPY